MVRHKTLRNHYLGKNYYKNNKKRQEEKEQKDKKCEEATHIKH